MVCYLSNNCKKYNNKECTLESFCIRKFKEDALLDMALLGNHQKVNFKMWVYENDPQSEHDLFSYLAKVQKGIDTFVQNGSNLYLYSTCCGNGKTSWAIRMLRSYIDKIWIDSEITCRALYVNVPKFLLELKANISNRSEYIEHIYKYVRDTDLVVWDDIGSKLGTEFEIEHMLSLINNRLDCGRSNIYTSNILPEMLPHVLGPRLSSRIIGMSQALQFNGGDKRGLKA